MEPSCDGNAEAIPDTETGAISKACGILRLNSAGSGRRVGNGLSTALSYDNDSNGTGARVSLEGGDPNEKCVEEVVGASVGWRPEPTSGIGSLNTA